MPLLSISQQGLRNATSGAADGDLVRIKDGKAVTARQSFFGRVLRIFPGGNRQARVENAAIRHVLLADLRRSNDAGTATAALEMVGLGATQGNAKPITVRQIREAHACAKVLSDQAQRAAAGLAASQHYPAAPGFADLARDAKVEPTGLTDAQRSHYQYMLQKHVALDPQRYLADTDAVRSMAVKALKYVSRMSDTEIETAQNRLTMQRYLADEAFSSLVAGEGANALVGNLQRLHNACQFGIADTMLGDTEYGAYLTVDELALEHAAAKLTPQQARKAYATAMANEGIGRAVLSAVAEQGDEFGRRSLNSKLAPDQERQLEVAALRAREFQSTTETVLKILGRRGGIDNAEQEIRDVARRTPERTRAALGAQATVRHQLVRAIDKETAQLKLRAAEFKNVRAQAREILLSEQLPSLLRQRGWLGPSAASSAALLDVRARILGPLSRELHGLEHDAHAGVPNANGVRILLDKVLNDEVATVQNVLQRHERTRRALQPVLEALSNQGDLGQASRQSLAALAHVAADTRSSSVDLQSLQHERQELGAPRAADSEAVRSWRSHLDAQIDELIAQERAADTDETVTQDNKAGTRELLAQWASALPSEDTTRLADALQTQIGSTAGSDHSALIQIRDALHKPLGITAGVLIPMLDEHLQRTLATEDTLPALFDSKPVRAVDGDPAAYFADGFYQDMHRMHFVLGIGDDATRIGMPAAAEPTDDDVHAAKVDGFERLVEFVGDEAMAARVSHFINQKLFGPLSLALQAPNSPIALADGTRGQILPVAGAARRSVTLSKTSNGAIQVHVEQQYAARGMSNPDGIRDLDPQRSYLRMGYDFSITADTVKATSPVTYDFRLAEAA